MGDSSAARFEALITIMDFGLHVLIKLFKKCNMPISLLTHGSGTANR